MDDLAVEAERPSELSWRRIVASGLALAVIAAVIEANLAHPPYIQIPRPPYMPAWVSDDLLIVEALWIELAALALLGSLVVRRSRRRRLVAVGCAAVAVALLTGELAVADRFAGGLNTRARSGGSSAGFYGVYSAESARFHFSVYRVLVLARSVAPGVARGGVTTGGGRRGVVVGSKEFSGDRIVLVQADGAVTETHLPATAFERVWEAGSFADPAWDGDDGAPLRRLLDAVASAPQRDAALARFLGAPVTSAR